MGNDLVPLFSICLAHLGSLIFIMSKSVIIALVIKLSAYLYIVKMSIAFIIPVYYSYQVSISSKQANV